MQPNTRSKNSDNSDKETSALLEYMNRVQLLTNSQFELSEKFSIKSSECLELKKDLSDLKIKYDLDVKKLNEKIEYLENENQIKEEDIEGLEETCNCEEEEIKRLEDLYNKKIEEIEFLENENQTKEEDVNQLMDKNTNLINQIKRQRTSIKLYIFILLVSFLLNLFYAWLLYGENELINNQIKLKIVEKIFNLFVYIDNIITYYK